MKTERTIGGKHCYIYENAPASDILIQAADEHDIELLDQEVRSIRTLTPRPFTLIAMQIRDWNTELSPWAAPPVFGKEAFGAGAEDTLAYIEGVLIPEIEQGFSEARSRNYYLGGYSLAGLFALWAAYRTPSFRGIAAASPSVWFPDWDAYITQNRILSPMVYLSLGDKEEKTRRRTMARVGENIRLQHELLPRSDACRECVLEWNPGNHFTDSEIRTAKAFAWLLDRAEPIPHSAPRGSGA